MKIWKHYFYVCFMAFIGCDNDNNDPPEVTREFNDLTFLGKNIKLIDETNNSQDLKARGIWQKIQDGLNTSIATPDSALGIKFAAIYAIENISIVINNGEDYINGYSFSDHKILFREKQLLEYSSMDIIGCIEAAILYDITLP